MQYLDVMITILGHQQRAKVRNNILVEDFIQEILRKFTFAQVVPHGQQYYLWIEDSKKLLPAQKFLHELALPQPAHLVFDTTPPQLEVRPLQPPDFLKRVAYRRLPEGSAITLLDLYMQQEIALGWTAILIGRESEAYPNLYRWILSPMHYPQVAYISRDHACLFVVEQQAYITPLQEDNPTYVNGHRLPYQSIYALKVDDEIQLGETAIRFRYLAFGSLG